MSVKITVDISDVMRELRRVEDGPDTATDLRLDGALTAVFQETQAIVHVITGSLRASGTHESGRGRHTWDGQISYGGASPRSVFDPVRYADYERQRGGHHDFMLPVRGADPLFVEAMLSFLRGDT